MWFTGVFLVCTQLGHLGQKEILTCKDQQSIVRRQIAKFVPDTIRLLSALINLPTGDTLTTSEMPAFVAALYLRTWLYMHICIEI